VVVWVVEGFGSGVDALFALYADIAIAGEDASFALPVDLAPETNFAMLVLTMRLQAAKSWMLSGAPLTAQAALHCGLVTAVVRPAELRERTEAAAERAARLPLDAVVASKLAFQVLLDSQGVASEFDSAPFYALAAVR
jgi:enoyl-CoA hydratase/carnithine racemase